MNGHIILDLSGIQTEADFHRTIRETFSFPTYYGENKDAFWDCITDFLHNGTILIKGECTLPSKIRKIVDDYIAILHEYEAESNGRLKIQHI